MAGDGEANKSKHGAPITSRPTRFSGKQKVRHGTCRLTQIRKHYIRKKTQNRDAEIASRRAAAGVVRAISAVLGKHVDVYLRALRQASPMSLLLDFFPKKDITVKSIIISILSKQTQKVFAWLILKDRLSTRNFEEECSLLSVNRRITISSIDRLPLCISLLQLARLTDTSAMGSLPVPGKLQKATARSILYGSHHPDE
jgi:hypothetical protein